MELLGCIETVSGEGRFVVKADTVPDINETVFDDKGKRMGTVKRVFGPVEGPYVTVSAENGMDLKQAVKAILLSDEAQVKLAADEDFVKVLYRLYFDREADAEGLAFWTEKLNAGESREAVVNVFEESDEFRAVLKGLKEKK